MLRALERKVDVKFYAKIPRSLAVRRLKIRASSIDQGEFGVRLSTAQSHRVMHGVNDSAPLFLKRKYSCNGVRFLHVPRYSAFVTLLGVVFGAMASLLRVSPFLVFLFL